MNENKLWSTARKLWKQYIHKEIVFALPQKLNNVCGYCWEGHKTKKGYLYTGNVVSVNVWGGMVVICVTFRLLNGELHYYYIPTDSILGIYEQKKREVCELIYNASFVK